MISFMIFSHMTLYQGLVLFSPSGKSSFRRDLSHANMAFDRSAKRRSLFLSMNSWILYVTWMRALGKGMSENKTKEKQNKRKSEERKK